MSVYGEFFTKFMEPLFEGFVSIFKGLGSRDYFKCLTL